MPLMTKSQTIRLRVTEEMRCALESYCTRHGIDLSDLLRASALAQIGREDLIETMPGRGRPPEKEPEPPPKPPKKKRRQG